MKPSPYNDQEFLSTIHRWLDERGEVLVFFDASGGPYPNLFLEQEQFQRRMEDLNKFYFEQLPYRSVCSAFTIQNYDFPLRGVMNESFAKAAVEMMSKGNGLEFLLLEKGKEGYYHYGAGITEPSELLDDLEDYSGKECVFGRYPEVSASPVSGIQVEAIFPISLA